MNVTSLKNESEFYIELVEYIHSGSLILIIGSGFTNGCKTQKNSVPDGKQIKEICNFYKEIKNYWSLILRSMSFGLARLLIISIELFPRRNGAKLSEIGF